MRWLSDASLWQHLRASVLEEVGGFCAAVLVAIGLGTAGGLSSRFRDFISPLNSLFMAIPPIAWAPLIIIFGLGYVSIVLVIFIAAVFPMAVTIQRAYRAFAVAKSAPHAPWAPMPGNCWPTFIYPLHCRS